jgi:alpha-1,4-fucosyltransferase
MCCSISFGSFCYDFFLFQRRVGEPLRAYMDLEAGRRRSGREDIYISYHAEDDVQSTYAGALFHNGRNYHVSNTKSSVSNTNNSLTGY